MEACPPIGVSIAGHGMTSRVASADHLLGWPAEALIEPDMQISSIRLSHDVHVKAFVDLQSHAPDPDLHAGAGTSSRPAVDHQDADCDASSGARGGRGYAIQPHPSPRPRTRSRSTRASRVRPHSTNVPDQESEPSYETNASTHSTSPCNASPLQHSVSPLGTHLRSNGCEQDEP